MTEPYVRHVAAPDFVDPDVDRGLEPPPGHIGKVPAGLALSERLAAALVAAGWEVPHRWVTYDGHGMEARRVGERFELALTCEDRDPEVGRFRVEAQPRRGLFGRLRAKEPPGWPNLVRALDAWVDGDAAVTVEGGG